MLRFILFASAAIVMIERIVRCKCIVKRSPQIGPILAEAQPSDLYGRSVELWLEEDGPLITGRLVDVSADSLTISPSHSYRVIRSVDLSTILGITIDGVHIRARSDLEVLPYRQHHQHLNRQT
jgi:hypothetical protein